MAQAHNRLHLDFHVEEIINDDLARVHILRACLGLLEAIDLELFSLYASLWSSNDIFIRLDLAY